LGVADDLQVVESLVDDLDGDVEFLGDADRLGFAAGILAGTGAEGGGEVEGLDIDTHVEHHLDGQGGVEPP